MEASIQKEMYIDKYLNNWMSSSKCLHGSSASLCFIVSTMVRFRLNLDLQAVWARTGGQLPVKSWQGWAR